MDMFAKKGLTAEALNTVGEIAKEMQRLNDGGGNKKEAKLSKVKDPIVKARIKEQADELEQYLKEKDFAILAILEVARRYKGKYTDLARESMVSLLEDAGMTSLELKTGERIVVSEKIEASIADKNYALARRNMITEDYKSAQNSPEHTMDIATEKIDNMFSKSLVIANPTEELKELLLDNDVEYDNKFAIHWQTLRKYCKERMSAGQNIPEGITTFVYKEAEIK